MTSDTEGCMFFIKQVGSLLKLCKSNISQISWLNFCLSPLSLRLGHQVELHFHMNYEL